MQINTGVAYGNGTLAQVIGDGAVIRRQLATLTQQAGDGLVSDTVSGLGAGAGSSLTLGSSLTAVQTWQTNAQTASGPMQTAQSALSQISDIASSFFAQTAALNGINATAIDTTAASARDALKQVAGLLNSKFGEVFVLAGGDSANAPVPNDLSL